MQKWYNGNLENQADQISITICYTSLISADTTHIKSTKMSTKTPSTNLLYRCEVVEATVESGICSTYSADGDILISESR